MKIPQILTLIRYWTLIRKTNELRGVEKKSGESFSTFSASVPLTVLFSNQFLHDLDLIWELKDYIPNPNKPFLQQTKNTI
jgi:hypothetical protein